MVRRDDVPYLFAFHTHGGLMVPAAIRGSPVPSPVATLLPPPLRRGDATHGARCCCAPIVAQQQHCPGVRRHAPARKGRIL